MGHNDCADVSANTTDPGRFEQLYSSLHLGVNSGQINMFAFALRQFYLIPSAKAFEDFNETSR